MSNAEWAKRGELTEMGISRPGTGVADASVLAVS